MKKVNVNELRKQLVELNRLYREGNPIVSDVEYDNLVEELRKASPNDSFFEKGIVEEATDRMELLPLPMYSLEKIKNVSDFRKWLSKMYECGAKEIVCTPKYDGISLLTYDRDGNQAWTRGDGVEGQRSDLHFSKMNNGKSNGYFSNVYTWGEAICKKKAFEHLKEKLNVPYKNARNMVAGVFNSPDGYKNSVLPFIDFVRYGINEPINKDIQLKVLRNRYQNVTIFKKYEISYLLRLCDEELNELIDLELHHEFNNEYKIDGVVFEVNEYSVREKLGRLPNGNPVYAIAFKRAEWCDTYQTKVTGIEFGIGKTGVLNPVIIVEPVEMDGVTVTRASAYNAAYLIDNHICVGALIEITRSGEVIPKHLKTIEYDENEFIDMMDDLVICPSCGEPLKWNESHVDLVCQNRFCKEREISEMVYFFRSVGCEGFEEPTIRTLYDNGWTSLYDYSHTCKGNYQKYLGKVKGEKVFNEIQRIISDGVTLAKLMSAYNVFEGKLAEKTCQLIIDNLDEKTLGDLECKLYKQAAKNLTVEKLVKIQGVGEITAMAVIKGLLEFQDSVGVKISYIKSPKIVCTGEKYYVCMTGFRDKELEKAFLERGHEVLSGVTSKCNLLITENLDGTSSKMKKAKEMKIRIVLREKANELLL